MRVTGRGRLFRFAQRCWLRQPLFGRHSNISYRSEQVTGARSDVEPTRSFAEWAGLR